VTAIPDLPALDEPQIFKLRQLSLLTLASPFAPSTTTLTNHTLTYPSLLESLSLPDAASLESLVTQSIYSCLLTARLSPTSNPPVVNITSVAPLRDLRPQSLPALLRILETWESRCTSVVNDLEAQISGIRQIETGLSANERRQQELVDAAVLDTTPATENGAGAGDRKGGGRGMRGGHRLPSKRDIDQQMEGEGDNASDDDDGRMDVDEGLGEGGLGVGLRGGHGGASTRGAKRNRGRGLK